MKSNKGKILVVVSLCVALMGLISCEETLPKPNAMLRLEYPQPEYESFQLPSCPYTFEKSYLAFADKPNGCSVNLVYPKMKGTIYLSYRNVQGDIKQLLTDVQKLTYEHVVKADNIVEQPYVNADAKKYGMFYEVSGNAASQSQFYLTDSVSHFITGSIYFDSKPNYDSILPAAVYLREDVRKIMESLEWKDIED
ncbi:gliding motility lipoprotein GldD [Neptunitalea lumnitzerae]|uniref:Gliding motility lipoprotein GldD n=1 Tax=Neptunitalea lumnitzerae TaxID=2965509 RepID=A0ABQ5MN07_9FLAO|nr:gliding motility lipoprotein GldD [Neptunitalea sp. Y10]GLB50774.1 gliding motility lipoprotein GldD [Neptunitalea sp. Y10]